MKKECWEYKLIDGNWSSRAVAYCSYKDGCLTEALMKTHRCKERQCKRLQEIEKEPI